MTDNMTFGEKLLSAIGYAGRHGRRARLHSIVDDAIKRHGVSATDAIMEAIDEDPALMVELLDEIKFRRPLVERFMQKRLAALREQGVTIKMPPTGGDRAGHGSCVAQTRRARPAEQDAPRGAGGGQKGRETQKTAAPAENSGTAAQDGTGHPRLDTHTGYARPSAPTQTDRAAMIANRNKSARAVLARMSNLGKPYGDCTQVDLENIVRRGQHEAQFAKRMLVEARFKDAETPLKHAISEADAAKLWSQAWEAVTHAA